MKENFNNLINSSTPVLVDFYADWCQPCKVLAPTLKDVAGSLQKKARIIKIDVDKNPKIAARYKIRGVPTLMLFKKGKSVWRQSGVLNKQQILNAVTRHLS